MTIFYCFGAVPTVAGIDLTILSKMAVGLTILGTCIPMAGILRLPKSILNCGELPDTPENTRNGV